MPQHGTEDPTGDEETAYGCEKGHDLVSSQPVKAEYKGPYVTTLVLPLVLKPLKSPFAPIVNQLPLDNR